MTDSAPTAAEATDSSTATPGGRVRRLLRALADSEDALRRVPSDALAKRRSLIRRQDFIVRQLRLA